MNGTTGLASWRMTGPAHTIATSAASGQDPTAAIASRQPPNATSRQLRRERSGITNPAAITATSIAMRIGALNSPNAPSVPRSSVSLSTAATIEASTASAIESNGVPRPARARTRPVAISRTLAPRTSNAAGSVTDSWLSTPSSACPSSNPSLSEAWSQVRPIRNAARPAIPTRSSAIASRPRNRPSDIARMVRGARMPQSVRGIGAGGGIRTRGILLGGQALFQLSYARSGCPAQSLLKSSKPVAVRADDIALAGLNQHPIRTPADHPGDTADLGRRIPMVEVHGALRDSATAIETRHGSELIQH